MIRPDVAGDSPDRTVVAAQHQLVAPTLLRSQVLSLLYREVRAGETSREQAERRLDHIRALRIRLLGDRVLQHLAWRVADQLGLPDTEDAEYLALTQLQADALISLDRGFAELAGDHDHARRAIAADRDLREADLGSRPVVPGGSPWRRR